MIVMMKVEKEKKENNTIKRGAHHRAHGLTKRIRFEIWNLKLSYEGGLFIDAFVHQCAQLRYILESNSESNLAATTSNIENIQFADTLSASVKFENGFFESISV
jgi:predicted dehydrogenase